MKILVVGGGGREHALAWKAAQSPQVETVHVAPGNAGTDLEPGIANVAIAADDLDALVAFARDKDIGLTIVGPEVPLVMGVVDAFKARGRFTILPVKAGRQNNAVRKIAPAKVRRVIVKSRKSAVGLPGRTQMVGSRMPTPVRKPLRV